MKITLWLLAAFLLAVIAHNAIYAVFGVEEPVFFITALIVVVLFIASLIYNTIKIIKSRPRKNNS